MKKILLSILTLLLVQTNVFATTAKKIGYAKDAGIKKECPAAKRTAINEAIQQVMIEKELNNLVTTFGFNNSGVIPSNDFTQDVISKLKNNHQCLK